MTRPHHVPASSAQSGFGTYTSPHLLMPLEISISKLLDKAIAWNLDSHVMSTSALRHILASPSDHSFMPPFLNFVQADTNFSCKPVCRATTTRPHKSCHAKLKPSRAFHLSCANLIHFRPQTGNATRSASSASHVALTPRVRSQGCCTRSACSRCKTISRFRSHIRCTRARTKSAGARVVRSKRRFASTSEFISSVSGESQRLSRISCRISAGLTDYRPFFPFGPTLAVSRMFPPPPPLPPH